jgi:transcriptional regulator with XRE-family HTH domain
MPRKPSPPEGLALQALREVEGLSQEEVAQGAGMDRRDVTDLERGRKPLSPERLAGLAKVLGFPAAVAEGLRRCFEWLYPPREEEGPPMGLSLADRRAVLGAALSLTAGIAQEIGAALLDDRRRRDRQDAERLFQPMRGASFADWERLFQHSSAVSWALVERLCAESVRAAATDARRALGWAELACRAAERTAGGKAWRTRVKGYATAFFANALRVAGDLPGADAAFARAWGLWISSAAAAAGPLEESRLFDLEASLRREQRRLPEALERLDRAFALCKSPEGEIRILLKKAFTFEQMGDAQRALAALDQAEQGIQATGGDPRQLCVLRFNRGVSLCQLGRFEEAAALLPGLRAMTIRLANELDLVRVLWLESRVKAGCGQEEEALAGLEQVRREFAARGMVFDLALTNLELARLYLRQGRTAETRQLAEETGTVLHQLGVEREPQQAVDLLREAARQEAATLELVERAIAALYRVRPTRR